MPNYTTYYNIYWYIRETKQKILKNTSMSIYPYIAVNMQ
jgi:hypothetical protein